MINNYIKIKSVFAPYNLIIRHKGVNLKIEKSN